MVLKFYSLLLHLCRCGIAVGGAYEYRQDCERDPAEDDEYSPWERMFPIVKRDSEPAGPNVGAAVCHFLPFMAFSF